MTQINKSWVYIYENGELRGGGRIRCGLSWAMGMDGCCLSLQLNFSIVCIAFNCSSNECNTHSGVRSIRGKFSARQTHSKRHFQLITWSVGTYVCRIRYRTVLYYFKIKKKTKKIKKHIRTWCMHNVT